ncbi:MAG: D-glycero-beta-D-manno-heptose 1-phosphate adenylyltransferase [Candidatus Cloacimonetes bacterium]|nr:D-glycero-beta-D-manno-heptose 1-phosphate adenylyltransferase [Candidatus Cloacimonadota bacterium]
MIYEPGYLIPTGLRQAAADGKKIVFTNGCFDILHAGHVQYLEEARGMGDILVVGLNSDSSVTRLKGSERPVNNERDRYLVLQALRAVDYVIIFQEDTPYELIREIQPDVLVKGGDWAPEEIVGSDIVLSKGGVVRSLRFVEGLSTTGVIEKLRGGA